jgi:hypothetical protein
MQLVWLVPSKQLFEVDWILDLLHGCNYAEVQSSTEDVEIYRTPLFVFNHSINYENFFKKYHELGIPFAAIHLSDETLGDTIAFYDSPYCRFVVRTYYHPIASMHPKVITIGLGYRQGYVEQVNQYKDGCRYFHWNFAGNIHDQHRALAVELFKNIIPYQLHCTKEGFNSKNNLPLSEYAKWMCDAKFALCPTGQGNIDSFRTYEACEATCIPIVIGNTMVQNCMPKTYWHTIFPMWREELPFVIGNSMQECAQKVIHLLMHPCELEEKQRNLKRFWVYVKQYWRNAIQTMIANGWQRV